MGLFHKKQEVEYDEEINIFKEIIEMLLYIAAVIVIVYLIIHFVGQRTEVQGNSMKPTLQDHDNLWIDKMTYRFKDIERFDIVVFPYMGSDTFYIKRVIGMPGETVFISEDGYVYINGELLEEDTYGTEPIKYNYRGIASEPVVLGPDEYFVMGDNRNNSQDSRKEQIGPLNREEIVGKAGIRIWPIQEFGTIDKQEN